MDITIRERIVCTLQERPVVRGYDEYNDLPEIDSKLAFRKRTRNGFGDALARKETRYKKLWTARLGAQMADLPPFEQVYRAVYRTMRAAGLLDA